MSSEGGSQEPSAASSLRETTKWLVGGVVVTAAGVFAGSSLTNLGSLDPFHDTVRLALALVGAVMGFVALGLIMTKAIAVLTVDSLTLRMIAKAEQDPKGDAELREVAAEVWAKFQSSAPLRAQSLSQFCGKLEKLSEADPRQLNANQFVADILPDAAFLYVRHRFARLTKALIPATALAVVGFGLFAWAANPPSDNPPKVAELK